MSKAGIRQRLGSGPSSLCALTVLVLSPYSLRMLVNPSSPRLFVLIEACWGGAPTPSSHNSGFFSSVQSHGLWAEVPADLCWHDAPPSCSRYCLGAVPLPYGICCLVGSIRGWGSRRVEVGWFERGGPPPDGPVTQHQPVSLRTTLLIVHV